MTSETIIHFCFIRSKLGSFASEIDLLLEQIFKGMDFSWQLNEKDIADGELVLAALHGRSNWTGEEEVVHFIDQQTGDTFWEYLHGYQITNVSLQERCETCGCT